MYTMEVTLSRFEPGAEITCTDENCDCSFVIQAPCPHGDDYRCGCGAALVPAGEVPEKSGVVTSD